MLDCYLSVDGDVGECDRFVFIEVFDDGRRSAIYATEAMGDYYEYIFRCFSELGVKEVRQLGKAASRAISGGREANFYYSEISAACASNVIFDEVAKAERG